MANLAEIIGDNERSGRAGVAFLLLSGSDLTGENMVYSAASDLVDDLSLLLALVIESDPEARTPQQLRVRGEDIGKRVTAFARAIRQHNDETGEDLISSFGVANTVGAGVASH